MLRRVKRAKGISSPPSDRRHPPSSPCVVTASIFLPLRLRHDPLARWWSSAHGLSAVRDAANPEYQIQSYAWLPPVAAGSARVRSSRARSSLKASACRGHEPIFHRPIRHASSRLVPSTRLTPHASRQCAFHASTFFLFVDPFPNRRAPFVVVVRGERKSQAPSRSLVSRKSNSYVRKSKRQQHGHSHVRGVFRGKSP